MSHGVDPSGGLTRMENRIITACGKQLKKAVFGLGKLCPVSPKNLSEGLHVCRTLHMHGICSTLGKFSKGGDDPAPIVSEYQLASDALKGVTDRDYFYLSLKPPALDFDIRHGAAIASVALQNGHGVHFDSHKHIQADPTIRLIEQVMDQNVPSKAANGRWNFSVTLPSRWRRSLEDAQWAINKGVRVRLVKGEFKAAYSSEEMDPGKGFLQLIDRLAGRVPEIAVASHDYKLAGEAIARCKNSGTRVQLELLFGMPSGRMLSLSSEMGVPVRFYVPYGDTLLVYGIRYFLENPRKFLGRNLLESVAGYKSKLGRIIASLQAGTGCM
jgi:proline dehydrogenase